MLMDYPSTLEKTELETVICSLFLKAASLIDVLT